jgi:predicted YcjX-like family ATPase
MSTLGQLAELPVTRRLRVGVTGLARAGKTALLTSVAANLLAQADGNNVLPALAARLAGRTFQVTLAPAGAADLPRFDYAAHLAALAADPPRWPARTDAVSVLALDVRIGWTGLLGALPPRRLVLEFLDYPGEWLLDLPMLGQDFDDWSAQTLRRMQQPQAAAVARDFLGFQQGLPARAPADDALAATGHALYRLALTRLRDGIGLSFLQPGRFLMPPPGAEPPWMAFFPHTGDGPLAGLLRARFDAYRQSVRAQLHEPSFGRVDRLVVLADLLAALHAGPAAFADTEAALGAVARALRWRNPLLGRLAGVLPSWLALGGGIQRVAFAASKSDHVAERQRGNLAALVRRLTEVPDHAETAAFAIAAVRCTEDFVWTLDGRNISAVRGRVLGEERLTRSYPGEVPDRAPEPAFWSHAFLGPPVFEPRRLPNGGRGGVAQIGLDTLLGFLLEDVL